MQYQVQTVADHELPEGIGHVIVHQTEGPPLLIITGQTARCWQWMRSWEDMVEPATVPSVAVPSPRLAWPAAV